MIKMKFWNMKEKVEDNNQQDTTRKNSMSPENFKIGKEFISEEEYHKMRREFFIKRRREMFRNSRLATIKGGYVTTDVGNGITITTKEPDKIDFPKYFENKEDIEELESYAKKLNEKEIKKIKKVAKDFVKSIKDEKNNSKSFSHSI